MLDEADHTASDKQPIIVKKYANRRLYNTETSTYVTLDDLGQMVRSDRDFVVYDAKTGDDLTHAVLTQIIVDQESRGKGPNLLPTPFLRQLIRFYDDIGVSKMVPGYLQMSLEALAREQERLRHQFAQSWGHATFEAYNEQVRKNLGLFEQAMRMWSPVSVGQQPSDEASESAAAAPEPDHKSPSETTGASAPASPKGANGADDLAESRSEARPPEVKDAPKRTESDELMELRGQLAEMQRKIEALARPNH